MTTPDTPLSGKQKAWLRSEAHSLRPVVRIGNAGVTDGVIAEVDRALGTRELIKVRLDSSEGKKEAAEQLAERTEATLCGLVGLTVILYRRNPEKEDGIVPPVGKG